MDIRSIATLGWRFVGLWILIFSLPILSVRIFHLVWRPESTVTGVEVVFPPFNPWAFVGPILFLGIGLIIIWKSKALGALISRGL